MRYTTEPHAFKWRPFCIILIGCFLLGLFFNTFLFQSNLVKGLFKYDVCEVVDFASESDCSSSSSSTNSSKDTETINDYHLDPLFVMQLLGYIPFSLSHQKVEDTLPEFPHLSLNAPPPELYSL